MPLIPSLVFLCKRSKVIKKRALKILYSMTTKYSIIGICNLARLIFPIFRVYFDRKSGNTFWKSIGKVIFDYLGCLNNIHIERCKEKIVIKYGLSNLPISH